MNHVYTPLQIKQAIVETVGAIFDTAPQPTHPATIGEYQVWADHLIVNLCNAKQLGDKVIANCEQQRLAAQADGEKKRRQHLSESAKFGWEIRRANQKGKKQ